MDTDAGKVIVTNEGIMDFFKSFSKRKKLTDMELGSLMNSNLRKSITDYLSKTLKDPKWVESNLRDKPDEDVKCDVAFIDGKPEPDFKKLHDSLSNMLKSAEDVVNKLSDNIKLRQVLCKSILQLRAGQEEKADDIYLQNEKKLVGDVEKLWAERGGKNITGVVGDLGPKTKGPVKGWPCGTDGNAYRRFQGYHDTMPDTVITGVDKNNYKDYIKVIEGLIDIIEKATKESKKNRIPYWDSLDIEYDNLANGDEIFDTIFVGQYHVPTDPLDSVFFTATSVLKSMIKAI